MKKWSDDYRKKWHEARVLSLSNRYPINWAFLRTPSCNLYYFLGYLAGDGHVSKNDGNNEVWVGSCKDPEIIYKFRNLLFPKHKVHIKSGGFYKKFGVGGICHFLAVRDPELWRFISAFDVKSPSIFKRVPGEFIYSFIRGFMDSDGYISIGKNVSHWDFRVGFDQKSKEYLEALRNLLLTRGIQVPELYKYKDRDIYGIYLSVTAAMSLLKLVYTNKGEFYLQRKYALYEEVVNYRESFGREKQCINLN